MTGFTALKDHDDSFMEDHLEGWYNCRQSVIEKLWNDLDKNWPGLIRR